MERLHWSLLPVLALLTVLPLRPEAQKQLLLPLDETRNFTVSSATPLEILVNFTNGENETAALRLETTGYSNRTLLLIARQDLMLHYWSLPFTFVDVDNHGDEKPVESFQSVGRTLCPPQLWPQQQQQQQVLLQVSTQSEAPVSLSASARLASNFRLSLNQTIEVLLQPSSPQLFFFDFNDSRHFNTPDLRAVRILVESNDSACGLVSVQRSLCPAQQMTPSVQQRGFWQTLLTSSVIFMRSDEFSSFLVVLLAFPNNSKCLPDREKNWKPFSSKSVTLKVEQILMQDYEEWGLFELSALVAAACCLCSVAVLVLVLICSTRAVHLKVKAACLCPFACCYFILTDLCFLAVVLTWYWQKWQLIIVLSIVAVALGILCICILHFVFAVSLQFIWGRLSRSLLDRKPAKPDEPHMVHVGHAVQLLAIAIFYCLPVVQLVLLQQKSLGSGDLDDCYYNFKCRFYVKTSIGSFYAFNNVISNAGYIAAGIVFMLTVKFKEKVLDSDSQKILPPAGQGASETTPLALEGQAVFKPVEIPRCYSAHYAAGLALAMEGVLSACYHVCPSHDTFQFDTAFMLMFASMLGLAVYSKRNLSSGSLTNVTFVALGVAVVVNSGGILLSKISQEGQMPKAKGQMIPFLFLGSVLFALSAALALAIYRKRHFRKRYDCMLAVLINLGLGVACFVLGLDANSRFLFAYMVLAVALFNAVGYFLYYCARKFKNNWRTSATDENERQSRLRCRVLSVLLFVGFAITCVWSLVYFFNAPTDFSESPAGSRKFNNECYVRWFGLPFDQHDLWHLLGSGALLFLLLFVLFMDIDEERLELTEERTF